MRYVAFVSIIILTGIFFIIPDKVMFGSKIFSTKFILVFVFAFIWILYVSLFTLDKSGMLTEEKTL